VNCGKWSKFARGWKPKELAQIPCAENTIKSTSASYAVFSARQPSGTKPISPEKTIVVGYVALMDASTIALFVTLRFPARILGSNISKESSTAEMQKLQARWPMWLLLFLIPSLAGHSAASVTNTSQIPCGPPTHNPLIIAGRKATPPLKSR